MWSSNDGGLTGAGVRHLQVQERIGGWAAPAAVGMRTHKLVELRWRLAMAVDALQAWASDRDGGERRAERGADVDCALACQVEAELWVCSVGERERVG